MSGDASHPRLSVDRILVIYLLEGLPGLEALHAAKRLRSAMLEKVLAYLEARGRCTAELKAWANERGLIRQKRRPPSPRVATAFGDRLLALRHERGLNQQEACQAAGVSTTAMSNYERNGLFPNQEILERIAAFFETPVDELAELLPPEKDRRSAKGTKRARRPASPPTVTPLGEKLASLRRERSLTLEKVREATGVSTTSLSDYERNGKHPTEPLLKSLADFYDVPVDELSALLPAKPEPPAEERARNAVGQSVQRLRQERGWSRSELADKVGYTATVIRNLELRDDDPRDGALPLIVKLAKVFGVELEVLVDGMWLSEDVGSFARHLTQLRRRRGLQRNEVARLLQVDPATVTRDEKAKNTTPQAVSRYAEFYGLSAADLDVAQ